MFRLRLRARGLRRKWPKHRSISAVAPDAQLYFAQLVADVAQLPQRFDLRISLGHALERLTAQIELASLLARPTNSLGRGQFLEARVVPMPLAKFVADVDAVHVHQRHHVASQLSPGLLVRELAEYFHVDWHANMFRARQG